MKQPRIFVLLLFFLSGLLTTTTANAEPPEVAVSIRPLYFLVQDLMQDIGQPELILTSQQSPHHDQIKPSQLRNINQADIVFWIGSAMESNLQKTIRNLPKNIEAYPLISSAGLHILHFSETEHRHGNHAHPENTDPHIWLDSQNAIQMARTITEILIKHDPENKAGYQHNLNWLQKKISDAQAKIQKELAPLKTTPVLALHNAWQYFAHRFELQTYQGINADGLENLGAKSYLRLKRDIEKNKYRCIIAGPETNYKKAQQLISDSNTHLILLDPLGNDLPDDAGYEQFMLHITAQLKHCLDR
ncbi:MAG TPA: hypothetical protein EYP51_09905 [Thiotrichales bacterium]|nr:hypothetical protein [Thiotrichales bacterium]